MELPLKAELNIHLVRFLDYGEAWRGMEHPEGVHRSQKPSPGKKLKAFHGVGAKKKNPYLSLGYFRNGNTHTHTRTYMHIYVYMCV